MLGVLADARAEAEALGGPVPREVDGLGFRVLPRGAPEGFRYLLDTGDDGEVWRLFAALALSGEPLDGDDSRALLDELRAY